jgi:hypothetical protein
MLDNEHRLPEAREPDYEDHTSPAGAPEGQKYAACSNGGSDLRNADPDFITHRV